MKNIKLSVIITHYNRFELLPYFLDYFHRHRHNHVEVILIDDGSDNFEQFQFTKKPNNFEVYHINRNRGIGYCRELGKNIARGEYLTYIDSDDICVVAPKGKGEYIICTWCGGRLYRDLEAQKKWDAKCECEEFRFNFAKFLENRNA